MCNKKYRPFFFFLNPGNEIATHERMKCKNKKVSFREEEQRAEEGVNLVRLELVNLSFNIWL